MAQASTLQRHALATAIGVPETKITVDVHPLLPTAIHNQLARRQTAIWANRQAATEYRHAARALASEHLSLRDIGTVLGVSFQRAFQLVNS